MNPELDLLAILTTVADHIRTHQDASGVEVVAEDKGNIEFEIKQALGKSKMCVAVGNISATNKSTNYPTPIWFPIEFEVAVFEVPLLNRKPGAPQVSASLLAARLADHVSHLRTDWGLVVVESLVPTHVPPYVSFTLMCRIGGK